MIQQVNFLARIGALVVEVDKAMTDHSGLIAAISVHLQYLHGKKEQ